MSAQSMGFVPALWVRFTSLLAPLPEARLERRQSEVRAKAERRQGGGTSAPNRRVVSSSATVTL